MDHPGETDAQPPLRRILGVATLLCVGVGGAIGSGIFRTPGVVAALVASPWIILLLWVAGGAITLLQSLVSAELATRFPQAGGEYQYLKEAYGEFAAFLFGWACTVFIIGAGAATIARALGDFAVDLFRLDAPWAEPAFACGAIVLVVAVNVLGLRTGAFTQNLITALKVAAVLGIAVGACATSGRWTPAAPPPVETAASIPSIRILFAALLPVFWPYTGSTDSIRLAEEVHDVNKALPRALMGSVGVLTAVYVLYNYALLCAASPQRMAGHESIHADIFAGVTAIPTRELILIASILICLGSISALFLANSRVTYALARDGLTFRFLARMSGAQAPVASLIAVGLVACTFALSRSFEQMLFIYFLGSGLLFVLTYFSLIVFRRRDRRAGRPFPADVYKTPAGYLVVVILIAFQVAISVTIIHHDLASRTYDSLRTLGAFAGLVILYLVWPKRPGGTV